MKTSHKSSSPARKTAERKAVRETDRNPDRKPRPKPAGDPVGRAAGAPAARRGKPPCAVDPSAGDVAVRLFESGFNCAESAAQALLPSSQHREALLRTATGFGGGIARHGLTCGAISGCALAAGFLLGRTEATDTEGKERAYRVIDAVIRRFEERYGTLECRSLIGFDFIAPHDEEEFNQRIKPMVCVPLLRFAVDVALEELQKAGKPGAAATQAA